MERYISYLRDIRKLSETTLKAYAGDLSEFLCYMAESGADPENPDRSCGRKYVAHLSKKGLDPRSVNRKISCIRKYYAYQVRENGVPFNPFDFVRALKTDRRLPVSLSAGDINSIGRTAENRSENNRALGTRDNALFHFLYATGCRISEALSVNLGNVDFERRETVITGKGNKQRVLFFGENAAAALRGYLPYRAETVRANRTSTDALFINSRGTRLTPSGASYILEKYIPESGIDKKVTLHTFRHTFATHILENGADIRAVQELMGHSGLSSTQIYTHVGIGRLKDIHRYAHPHGRIEKQGEKNGI